jgi:predicted nuclease of predicted toxin-antitoxin system
MKILVDMNLSPGWVGFLTEAGFEAVHWSAVGASSAPDGELMQWAVERDYVVLTADLDFGAILAATQSKRPSVVQLRSDILMPRAIGGAVVAAIRQTRHELLDGALVSVDPARARLRILPLRAERQTWSGGNLSGLR